MSSHDHAWQMDARLALHGVQTPRAARALSRLLVVMLSSASCC